MKKNTMMRIASVLLIAVLITTCAISGTFAKYTSTVSGSSTTQVAKWAFTSGGNAIDLTSAKTFTFNLFAGVNDTLDGEDETDVADERIAPGTTGSVTVDITNASEVNVNYTLDFSECDFADVPFEWSTDGSDWGTFEELKTAIGNSGSLNMTDSKVLNLTIHWRWAYGNGSTDSDDTALGIAAAAGTINPVFKVTVTLTQVD